MLCFYIIQVFEFSEFTVPVEVEAEYYNAQIVPLAEVLASGADRRVSVSGVVKNVSSMANGNYEVVN